MFILTALKIGALVFTQKTPGLNSEDSMNSDKKIIHYLSGVCNCNLVYSLVATKVILKFQAPKPY